MSRNLRDAIERIHSDDFQKMRETERRLKGKGNGRKGFWRRMSGYDRLKATPARRVMRALGGLVCVVFVAYAVVATIYYYNRYKTCMVTLDHDKALWDNELQRRASLLPNLILVSVEYSAHEKVLFEYVTEMRRYLGAASGQVSSDAPDSPLNKLMSSLLAVSEQYPDLKATQSFEQLMKEWTETEDRVAEARITYIKSIRELNDLYARFPSNVFGRLLFVKNREQWTFDSSEAQDIDLEKAFKGFLVERAGAKSPRPIERKIVSAPADLAEPDNATAPEPQDLVSPEDAPK